MGANFNNDKFIATIRDGSEEAFKLLFDSFQQKIYTVSKRMGMSNDEAEDVIQDSFLQLWRQRALIKEGLSISGLLYTIAKRIVLKKLGEKKCHSIEDHLESCQNVRSNHTEEVLSFLETNQYVNQIIDQLPEQQRIVFSMNFNGGLTPQEISDQLDISKRTAENQIFRARKILKIALVKAGILSFFLVLFLVNMSIIGLFF